MNRASMLRLAAAGIIGLGAALLIAAVLPSTYTSGNWKIPLDIDQTLAWAAPAPRWTRPRCPARVRRRQGRAGISQQAITVRRNPGQRPGGHLPGRHHRPSNRPPAGQRPAAGLVDTVTLNRSTAEAVSDDEHPGGSVQASHHRRREPSTNIALPHDGLSYRFPFDTEKKSYPMFDAIAQKAFDANYDGEDDVNGLSTYRFTQNVGYDADGKLVDPIKYASLYEKNEEGEVTARAGLWGLPGDPYEPVTMTRYYAAQRTFWWTRCRAPSSRSRSTPTTTTPATPSSRRWPWPTTR